METEWRLVRGMMWYKLHFQMTIAIATLRRALVLGRGGQGLIEGAQLLVFPVVLLRGGGGLGQGGGGGSRER